MKYKIFGSSCKLEPAEIMRPRFFGWSLRMTLRHMLLKTGESAKTLNARFRTSSMTGKKVEGAHTFRQEDL
jgi:hypothetical protein